VDKELERLLEGSGSSSLESILRILFLYILALMDGQTIFMIGWTLNFGKLNIGLRKA